MEGSHDLFSRLLSSGPSQSTLLLVLEEMKGKGRLHEVIQQCIKALDIYPDDIRLRNLLAKSYLEAGFIGQAENELERVVFELKALSSALKIQADIYLRQSRVEEASRSLKAYLTHHPDDTEASELLAQLHPSVEKATLKEIPEEIETEPSEPEIDFSRLATPTLAEIYFNQGQIQEAVTTYEKVLEKNPEDEESRRRLAELKGSLEPEPGSPPFGEGSTEKKEKLISALEGWLQRIQELNRGT